MESKETFFARLSPILTPSDLLKVELAYLISKDGHRHQFRKELDEKGDLLRYFEHPRRTALILIDELDIFEPDQICAHLLHDALEDTHATPELIEHYFGKEVIRVVKLVSKMPKEGYYDRLFRFGDERVILAKLCDRLDNMRSLESAPVEFQEKQVLDTMKNIYPLCSKQHKLFTNEITYLSKKITILTNKYNAEHINKKTTS